MFRIAFGKASRSDRPIRRMKPARHTSETPRSRRAACQRAVERLPRRKLAVIDNQRFDSRQRCARSRACASARFEMTTRNTSHRADPPRRINQCLKIRATARDQHANRSSRVDDAFAAGAHVTDHDGASFTGAASASADFLFVPGVTRDDQPDPHIERAQHVGVRNLTGPLQPLGRWAGRSSVSGRFARGCRRGGFAGDCR